MDDLFTRAVARLPFDEARRIVRFDLVHPPMFYLVQRAAYVVLPDSLVGMRTLPIAFGVATVLLAVTLMRRLGFPVAAIIAAALIAISPIQLRLSIAARSYSLFAALVTLVALSYLTARRNLLRDTVLLVPLCLLHYFAPIYAALLMAGGWWRRRAMSVATVDRHPDGIIRYSAPLFVGAALLGLWLLYLLPVLHARGLEANLGWVPQPSLAEVFLFVAQQMVPGVAGMRFVFVSVLLLLCALLFLRTKPWRSSEGRAVLVLGVAGVAPIVMLGLLAHFTRKAPIWVDRHFVASHVLIACAFAAAFELVLRRSRWPAYVPFLAVFAMSVQAAATTPPPTRDDYSGMAQYLRERVPPTAPILSSWGYGTGVPVSFYYERSCLPRSPHRDEARMDWTLKDDRSCRVRDLRAYGTLPDSFLLVTSTNTLQDSTAQVTLGENGFTFRADERFAATTLQLLHVRRAR